MKIRNALETDYLNIINLFSELETMHRENHPERFKKPETDYPNLELYLDMIRDVNHIVLVAEKNDIICGLLIAEIKDAPEIATFVKRKYIELINLVVKEKRKKIGSFLLDKLESIAKQKEINQIELNVYAFNKNAYNFYYKNSFKIQSYRMIKNLCRN